MADHGGHDRSDGSEMPEDMTIPLFFYGEDITAGEIQEQLSLLNVAPTIAAVLGINSDPDWEGKSIVKCK
jgi:arylsulfatase A-like enzyme